MYFYHHYLKKGYKMEYLLALDFWTKEFMVASLDLELKESNEEREQKSELLQKGVMAVVTL